MDFLTKRASKDIPKVVVILGPTAAGKTQWGIDLAKQFDGEVISADSRQMYKKMTIGTAKEVGDWKWDGFSKKYLIQGVPHYLVDFLDPGEMFTSAEFRDKAASLVRSIAKRGKTPFIVGGTGLYIQTLVDNLMIPRVPPNKKLREGLEQKTHDELMVLLRSMDPEAAQQVDPHNKRRLVRALEVCILSGELFSAQRQKGEQIVEALQIGVDIPREELYERIGKRVDTMIERGLEQEVASLVKQKYGWQLPSMSGIGYRQWREYFEGKKTLKQVVEDLKRDSRHFARRQMTWFRRDPRIVWCKTKEDAVERIGRFFNGIGG